MKQNSEKPAGGRSMGGLAAGLLAFVLIAGIIGAQLLFFPSLRFWNKPTDAFQQGIEASNRAEYDRAIELFSKVIQQNAKDAAAYTWRGMAYSATGQGEKALADLSAVVRLSPNEASSYYNRALLHEKARTYPAALADYEQAVRLDPKAAGVVNNLAWLLSTCPQVEIRDGKRAVELATKTCELEQWKTASAIDTLAAACAEAGDFAQAVKWQAQCLAMLDFPEESSAGGRDRLALYQAGKPYREKK
jgi:tetratricopeptide (TPR) repeat protein